MKNRAVSLFGVPGKRPPCLHERVFSLLRWVLMRAAGAQPICRAVDGGWRCRKPPWYCGDQTGEAPSDDLCAGIRYSMNPWKSVWKVAAGMW